MTCNAGVFLVHSIFIPFCSLPSSPSSRFHDRWWGTESSCRESCHDMLYLQRQEVEAASVILEAQLLGV